MSMATAHGTPTVLNKDRRTVPQLLAAAAKDTDAASVFYNGTGPADYDSAILVIKGRENVDYVVAMLARQQLVTPGKPVEGSAAPQYRHVGECATDETARQVCEGIYEDRVMDNLALCEALRAVYSLAGESKEIAKLVHDAIAKHGIAHA
jgi:hypothetical protein